MLRALLRPLLRQIAIEPSGDTLFGLSAVRHWPPELLAGLERARLIESGPSSDTQICPGCAHACVLPVCFTSEGGFIQCNQTDVDYGLVELEPSELSQWHASRSRIVAFVAREMNFSLGHQDGRALHHRLGTWGGGGLRRAISLDFKNTAMLRVGDSEVDLSELMKWDGRRVCIDHHELEIRAAHSADPQTGGKRHQPSRLKQLRRAALTEMRNLRLQEMAERLKHESPAMKKMQIAEALSKHSVNTAGAVLFTQLGC